MFVAALLIWVDHSLLNSDNFTATLSSTLDKPEVQKRIASVMVDEALRSGDISQRVEDRIPPQFAFATPAVNAGLQPFLERVATNILATAPFEGVRDNLISRLHHRLVAILENDRTVLRVEGKSLTIDLNTAITRLFDELGIEVPARLQEANPQIVLVKHTAVLGPTSWFVDHASTLKIALFLASIVSLAGAVFMAPNRARGVGAVGLALILTGSVLLLGLFILNRVVSAEAGDHTVALEVFRAFERSLQIEGAIIIVIGCAMVALREKRVGAAIGSAKQSLAGFSNRIGTTKTIGAAAVAVALVAAAFT